MSNSEPSKETQKEAKILSPSASANITIYNKFVFNIHLKPEETQKTEEQTQTSQPEK